MKWLDKVIKTDTCWLWEGAQTHNGYGNGGGKMAHRAVYEDLVGPIPEGLTLDHLCRVRLCVNPAHLEPVTIGENIRRSPRAISSECKYGHQYRSQSKFYQIKGARRCHECHATRERRRKLMMIGGV